MKSLHLILVLFSIASMFTSFGVYDVDATKEDNNGKSMGCEKANPKNNPHCNGSSPSSCDDPELNSDRDSIPDCEDVCPLQTNGNWIRGNPDHDGDGIPDSRDSSTICVNDPS